MRDFSVQSEQPIPIAARETVGFNRPPQFGERIRRFDAKRLTAFLSRQSVRQKIAVIVAGAIFLYVCMDRGLSFRELIISVAALTIVVILFNGERGVEYGFVLWVLTLALGYRTVALTPELHIHPSEILLWVLLGCIALHRRLVTTSKVSLPLWMWLMIPFWVLAWWPLVLGNALWDRMLNEFRNFFLLVPLMIVATMILQRQENWRRLLLAFFAASTWIAVMGILEFWFSSIANLLPGFITATSAGTIEGFERANFSFWGGPMATFICALALPIAIIAWRWWPAQWQRALISASVVCQFIAIYIGGYRSVWFVMLLEIVLTCFLALRKNRLTVLAAVLILVFGGYQFLPQAGHQRASSAIEAMRGHPTDSSARDRIGRAQTALEQMVASPLGNGWASAGWVHSDFVQVGANLGFVGGLIFFGGYLFTLGRLLQRTVLDSRGERNSELGVSLLLAYVSAGGILLTQGVQVLPQLVLPVWFIWVLVEIWLRQTMEVHKPQDAFETVSEKRLGFDYSAI